MTNVLLIGSGTQGLSIIPALHRMGCGIYVLGGAEANYGNVSRHVQRCFWPEDAKDESSKLSAILKCACENQIDVLIPMGDSEAELVTKNAAALSHIKFKMPTYENFLRGYDKNKLLSLCQEKGYPHPQTLDLSKTAIDSEAVRTFPFPAMLKPNCTTGGRGMVYVSCYDECASRYPSLHEQYGDYHLQKFIEPGGRQVKIQLYVDEQKQLVASSVQQKLRWYPNKAGSNCCAVSIEEPKAVEICYNVLKDIDWLGFADFDLIGDPVTGELLIMEINPRLPACVKGSIVAGIEWGEIIVNEYLGLPRKNYEYKTGVYLRHLGLEMLWFLHADKHFGLEPSWFKFFGRNIFYQDMNGWCDPMPFLKGTWNNIAKLFNPEFRKAKSQK